MATLYITELTGAGFVGAQQNHIVPYPAAGGINAFQTITLSVTSVKSSVLNVNTAWVKLVTDTACVINYGASTVTASVSQDYLPANQIYYIAVQPSSYIAAIL